MTAYHDEPYIHNIIHFPIIAYPTYKLVKANPLPIHVRNNIFVGIKINYPLLAIDKENRQYKIINKADLADCIKERDTYTCKRNSPTYYAETNAPCEVQTYAQTPGYLRHCTQEHIHSNVTVWITLTEPNTWLYSTPNAEEISIKCDHSPEEKIVLNGTGKIKLTSHCKLTTPHATLTAQKSIGTSYIQTYLPKYNITEEYRKENSQKKAEKTIKHIIRDPLELTKLSLSLKEVEDDLEENNNNIFTNKYFLYPTGTGTIIVIVAIAVAIVAWIVKKNKMRKQKETTSENQGQRNDAMLY